MSSLHRASTDTLILKLISLSSDTCTSRTYLLAEFGGELESVRVSHVGEEEGVEFHPLVSVFTALQREQLPLPLRLLEPVVHCGIHSGGDLCV